MRKFIDVTGKTEDEAISKALAQLNMDRDDVSVEILERAKSGFLGLGSSPAKVRVSYGPEEVEELPKVEPVVEKPVEKKAEKPAASEKKTEKKPEKKAPKKDKPAKVETPAVSAAPAAELGEEVNDEKAQAIRKFLAGLLEQMGNEADIHVYQPEKGRYKVILEGPGLGALIGRRGDTLDAIVQAALCEAQIESLVIAKGYTDCVTYMSSDGVSIAVSAPEGGLQDDDVAVIADIVTSQSEYTLDEIRIVEVK